MSKKLQITLVKSPISAKRQHKETIRSLGLRKIRQTVEQPDNAAIRGMIQKVSHMVEVEEVDAKE
jgi:large subunit ribosomal protein L30